MVLPVLIGLVLMLQSCVYFNIYYNAKKHYRNAERDNAAITTGQVQAQNYTKAIETAAKIPEMYPESKYVDDALLLMGKCYYKTGNYSKAERKFDEILANYPDSPLKNEAILYKGKCLISNRSYDQAYEVLNQLNAPETKKDIALDSRFSIGELLYKQEKYLQAADIYLKLMEDYKKKAIKTKTYLKAAECFYKSGKYAEAAEYFLLGSKYRGSALQVRFDALYQRTICLRNLGEYAQAEKELRQLLKNQKFFTYYPKAKALLAEVLYASGMTEEAVKLLQEVTTLKPKSEESAQSFYLLGLIFQKEHSDYKKAEENLGKVKTEKADSPYADSAAAALKILASWRGITTDIDSVKALIQKDLNLLAGVEDTTASVAEGETEIDLRQLFESGDSIKAPEKPPEYQEQSFGQEIPDFEEIKPGESLPDTAKINALPDSSAAGRDSTGIQGDSTGGVMAEPAVVDTQMVLQRIEDNIEDLNSLMYQLAEALHFQMGKSDSCKVILTMLADSTNSLVAPKSLFLLSYLAKMEGDSAAVDSLDHLLLEKYPRTIYAGKAAENLGLEWEYAAVDSGKVIFQQAEKLYFEEERVDEAFKLYAAIDSVYEGSPYAPKAIFARAYIAQYDFQQDSAAIELYRKLAEKYPKDTLGVIGKKRSEKQASKAAAAVIDTTAEEEYEGEVYEIGDVDTPPVCSMDSTQISQFLLDNNYYPQVALSAQKNGKVVLELTVDIYGYTKDIEVIAEAPTGYGFGQAAEEAAADFRYTAGKIGNRPVEVRIEQIVLFKK